MNGLSKKGLNGRLARSIIIVMMSCAWCKDYAIGMHINGHIEVVNLEVNKKNRAALPEVIFDVTLKESCGYDVSYKEMNPIATEERLKIEDWLGQGRAPTFRYVDSKDLFSGTMPLDIRQLFNNIDAFCLTNGTDYFAASIDSKIVNNGEYCRALSFVLTNTPPSDAVLTKLHPVFGKLLLSDSHNCNSACTNSIPIGSNPALWF